MPKVLIQLNFVLLSITNRKLTFLYITTPWARLHVRASVTSIKENTVTIFDIIYTVTPKLFNGAYFIRNRIQLRMWSNLFSFWVSSVQREKQKRFIREKKSHFFTLVLLNLFENRKEEIFIFAINTRCSLFN